VNTLNALFISQVGLHDWDMFISGMGRISSIHAAARALSGGPVYTSDTPDTQNSSIYRQLAFPDGALPRCLRSARPVDRFLFEDPQRTAGVPLMIQNTNNAGGHVIGVFNILGAVV
jgi:hypothetical protein